MNKAIAFSSLPLEVGTNSKDSFTDFPSLDFDDLNYDGSPFDEDPLSDSSQYQQSSESWEDFQSLSPFGLDWEMEQEFFKSDITDLECKKQGPTLAELNNQRSTSPLINPEMERLHRIATRSELEQSSSSSPCDIKIRVDGPDNSEASKKNMLSCTRTKNNDGYSVESYPQGLNSQSCGSGMRAQESTVIPRVNASSTITIKQEPTETIELKHSDLMKRIAYLEAKSNSQDANAQSSGVQNFTDVTAHSNRRRTSSECSSIDDEHLSVIREESADEDMDSDDDFEENHVKDNLEVPAKQRKGRRGDVEDMNPNPRKLLEISRELNRLTKIITDLKPIHSLPMTSRNKSKKEKNKLASRACRLKKKAQHESNKLKLYGLELEHKRLVSLIEQVKKEILKDTQGFTITGELSSKVEKLIHDTVGTQVIAGHTTAFVESVLKTTASSTPGYKDIDIHLNI